MTRIITMWDDAESLVAAARRLALQDRPDFGNAFDLLTRAFELGSPEAAYALGTWYLHGRHVRKNLKRAMHFLEIAADGDVAAAHFDLAVSYEKGIGTRKDVRRAARHYLSAALLGDVQSIYEVGRCFYFGIGVARDQEIGQAFLDAARLKGFED